MPVVQASLPKPRYHTNGVFWASRTLSVIMHGQPFVLIGARLIGVEINSRLGGKWQNRQVAALPATVAD